MHKKIKVAWICHFSNEKIREKLPLTNKRKYSDFSPWIINTLQAMKGNSELELHVISPHRGLKKLIYNFYEDNIHYYFFKPDLPIIHKMWPYFFPVDQWSGYIRNKLIIKHLINKIKPDIINLHGAENPYYSSAILDLDNYPVYIAVQGIYSNPKRFQMLNENIYRSFVECKIHRSFKYFGIRAPFMADLINRDNENAIFLLHNYPAIKIDNIFDIKEKKYDYVYFARITPTKGIEDLLGALALIKISKPKIKLNIIGPGGKTYVNSLKHKVNELGLRDNVTFSGFFSAMQELHQEVIKARISVLPTKIDTIPGTIIESIKLGLPVVSYNTGGIPLLNSEGQAVLLCEKGDIKALANNMLRLLEDQNLADELVRKAQKTVTHYFAPEQVASNMINQYRAIIEHYHNGKPIDEKLLFNKRLFSQVKF